MKELMKAAHEMTKEIRKEFPEVDYQAQLGLCISYLYNEGGNEMKVEAKLQELGYKVWEKGVKDSEGYKRRIYTNNLMQLAEKLNIELLNPKALRNNSMYFDCLNETFYYDVTSSREATVKTIIEELRK